MTTRNVSSDSGRAPPVVGQLRKRIGDRLGDARLDGHDGLKKRSRRNQANPGHARFWKIADQEIPFCLASQGLSARYRYPGRDGYEAADGHVYSATMVNGRPAPDYSYAAAAEDI